MSGGDDLIICRHELSLVLENIQSGTIERNNAENAEEILSA